MDRIDYLRAFVLLLQVFMAVQKRAMDQLLLHRRRRRVLRLRRMTLLAMTITGRRNRAVWSHPRAQLWWDTIVPGFNDKQFVANFRLSRVSFLYVCQRLSPILQKEDTNYRLSIPVNKRVAIALWRLATNSEYRSISHLFGVGIATVYRCVQEFCDACVEVLLPDHIKTPDARKLKEMATFFGNRWRAPQCVGAVDGSHIPIIAPDQYPRDYFNRKGWHSIILQAVVDGKGLMWDVCVGYPGSVHDSRVLQQSRLWELAVDEQLFNQGDNVSIAGQDVGYYIIGDPAYPLKTWLMKPFSDAGRLTPRQHRYNYRLSSARSVVETAFGRLKGRFRCLLKRNDCSLELTKKMVLSCCVLHNICEEHGDQYDERGPAVRHVAMEPGRALMEGEHQEGSDVRAALMDFFNSD